MINYVGDLDIFFIVRDDDEVMLMMTVGMYGCLYTGSYNAPPESTHCTLARFCSHTHTHTPVTSLFIVFCRFRLSFLIFVFFPSFLLGVGLRYSCHQIVTMMILALGCNEFLLVDDNDDVWLMIMMMYDR